MKYMNVKKYIRALSLLVLTAAALLMIMGCTDEPAAMPGEPAPMCESAADEPAHIPEFAGDELEPLTSIIVLMPPKFHEMRQLHDDLIAVSYGGRWDEQSFRWYGVRWGLIDSRGDEIIPPRYSLIERTGHDGRLMQVAVGEWPHRRWGFIDARGNEVIPPKYNEVRRLTETLVAVSYGGRWDYRDGRWHGAQWGILDNYGNEIVSPQFDEFGWVWDDAPIPVRLGKLWGFIDMQGNEVVPPTYHAAEAFHGGFARVGCGELWGLIDTQGSEIVPPQYGYDEIWSFSDDGFALVRRGGEWEWLGGRSGRLRGARWGVIDMQGREIIPPRYDGIMQLNGGVLGIRAEEGDKWAIADMQGNEIVPPRFDDMRGLSENLIAINYGGLWGIIDTQGSEVVPPRFDDIGWGTSDGLIMASLGSHSQWGVIDTQGREVIPFRFGQLRFEMIFEYVQVGLSVAGIGSRGDLALAAVGEQSEQRWGLIDIHGGEIIAPRYKEMRNFSEGFSAVSYGGRWEERLTPPPTGGGGEWLGGWTDIKWGFVDRQGNEIVPPRYDEVWDFSDGLAVVRLGGEWDFARQRWYGARWGLVDTQGNEIVPPQFDGIVRFGEDLIGFRDGDKWGLASVPEGESRELRGDRSERAHVCAIVQTISS